MSTKHTPGPWEVWPEVHGSHPRHLVYISVGPVDKRRVCSTGVYGHKRGAETSKKPVVTEEECRANARLIAAAPDMLAALIEAEDRLAMVLENDTDEGRPVDGSIVIAWERARAAIAKATGETP